MFGKRIVCLVLALLMALPAAGALADKGPTLKDLQAEIEGKTPEEIRAWSGEIFEGALHADPAEIPYPAGRLEDGYLPAGEEFVHEDPEKGLWWAKFWHQAGKAYRLYERYRNGIIRRIKKLFA